MHKKPLPIGISDFKKLIDGGYAYVDKTLLIEEIVDKGAHVISIPRMRRFGKTLNISMLRHFFEKFYIGKSPQKGDFARADSFATASQDNSMSYQIGKEPSIHEIGVCSESF